MIGLGALTFLPTNTLFCLNPLSIYNFVKKGTIINKKMDELADIHDEFKKRAANSIDKFGAMLKMQKHSCWYRFFKLLTVFFGYEAKGMLVRVF